MSDIQRADPVTRRRALLAAVAIAAIGWAAFFVLQGWLAGLEGADAEVSRKSLERALLWGAWAAALPVAALAAWLWLLGARVRRTGRYPTPGAKVIRDTPVLAGRDAIRRGIVFQVMSVVLGVGIAAMLVSAHRLVAAVERSVDAVAPAAREE